MDINLPTVSLPNELREKYLTLEKSIKQRLDEFRNIPESEYFYEFCFCLCTPQSKAENANQVIEKLKKRDFYNEPFNPVEILRSDKHYIRFHNQKSNRLLKAREYFPEILSILQKELSPIEKRLVIMKIADGIGMKESSHFLRNIGYRDLAILDRHILKHLLIYNVIETIPKNLSITRYLEIEKKFLAFAEKVKIPLDELDLLFWSYETGKILK